MTERYSVCQPCAGMGEREIIEKDLVLMTTKKLKRECTACGGTGIGGSALYYQASEEAQDWERLKASDPNWEKRYRG